MPKKRKKMGLVLWLVPFLVVVALGVALALHNNGFAVLDSQGEIADKQRNLLLITTVLGLFVVIPVFVLTFWIAWHYREGNHKAKYSPELDGNIFAEFTWWAIPCAIILVLAGITWQSTHELDPTRKLVSSVKPLTIQVVALQWRWLFIYPEQKAATLNYVQFPEKTPVHFEITSDAPMNSFWIPNLGGQIYAMSGMSTELNLKADKPGSYRGSSANISGEGFSDMNFTANSLSRKDFNTWMDGVRHAPAKLDWQTYDQIAKASRLKDTANYSLSDKDLYNRVVMKYMMPGMTGDSNAY